MKAFMDREFLLTNEVSKALYHDFAENMPIIDFHCHISPREIAEDRKFENITQAWLYGDHYKWRAMRSNGVDERCVTGDAPDYDKFLAWAGTLPLAVGNPLYHWTHLELRAYFGYDGALNRETAPEVWEICNTRLKDLSVKKLIEVSNVKVICTTDDPADGLEWHRAIRTDAGFGCRVLPGWRPDKAMNIESDGFASYISRLSEAAGVGISCFDDVLSALKARLDYFAENGCAAADHGMSAVVCAPAPDGAADGILKKRLGGGVPTAIEADQYRFAVLKFLAGEYARRGWVMELHYGANRNANTLMFEKLGPDTGFDSINGVNCAVQTAACLDALNTAGALPKTMIFSLNPADDAIIGSIIGCFQSAGIPGRIQQGSAWWFNDTKRGMINQMSALAEHSLLGNFVGMLTDSRSFLSYTRHDYFRRILCGLIGGWVENGEYPYDRAALKTIIQGICYYNAERYFRFDS